MLLAQIQSADPVHVWNFLLIIGFFLSAGASMTAILTSRKTQKREVSFADDFVRKSEWDVLRDADRMRTAKLESDHLASRQALSEEISAMSDRIEKLRDEFRADVRRLHDRIDGLPGEVIATLRNTGALK